MNPALAHAALLVIDMQRDFCAPGGYADQAGLDIERLRAPIEPIRQLLLAARRCGLFVVHTREGHRADLTDLPETKRRRAEASGASIGSSGPMGRLMVRGEYGNDLIDELQPEPATEVCVSSTLRHAVDLGFSCLTVADACGSAYPALHAAALSMIGVEGGLFGEVITSDALIALLEMPA